MPRRAAVMPPAPALPAGRGRTRFMPVRILAVAVGGFVAFAMVPLGTAAKVIPQGPDRWPCKVHVNCAAPAKAKPPAHRPAPHRTPERQP